MSLSTEILVTVLVIAAAVVGWFAIPSRRGAVRQFIITGMMYPMPGDKERRPTIEVNCLSSGDIAITRYPLAASVSEPLLNVDIAGNDIRITEQATPANDGTYAASFILNMVGQDYWHVRYFNPATGHLAVFTLHNRPGIRATHYLST